jgi:hypothetical protein
MLDKSKQRRLRIITIFLEPQVVSAANNGMVLRIALPSEAKKIYVRPNSLILKGEL